MSHCLLINKSHKKGSIDLKKFYSLKWSKLIYILALISSSLKLMSGKYPWEKKWVSATTNHHIIEPFKMK